MSAAVNEIERIFTNLEKGPYKVKKNVALSDGQTADLAASRSVFSWKGLVIMSQHILVRHLLHATLKDVKDLFDAGFIYGKKTNKIPLIRGCQFGYMIVPVIVADTVDPALLAEVEKCPPKHFALFEYPIIIDLSQQKKVCFRGTAMWGAFFFSDLRKVADTYIL